MIREEQLQAARRRMNEAGEAMDKAVNLYNEETDKYIQILEDKHETDVRQSLEISC